MLALFDFTEVGTFGFVNFCEEDYDERHDENAECDEERGGGVADGCFGGLADERAHDDVHRHGSSAVEHTAYLDELVAFVAAASEDIKHGVYNGVEHTHAETADESAHKINPKCA